MQGLLEFAYLRDVATKYGNLYFVKDFDAFIEHVNDDQLVELRSAYDMIARNKDDVHISQWIENSFRSRAEVAEGEFWFSRQVAQLFRLFEYLGRKGIKPFSSYEIGLCEQYKTPNWDNLPMALHYLIDTAETYGIYDTESDILTFLECAHEKDLEVLVKTAERIRLNNHSSTIDKWLRRSALMDRPEAWMIQWLLALMDHAGLTWE